MHTGSGTLLEALRAPYLSEQAFQRQIVAVSNPVLMDDHQAELARALADPKPYVHLADATYVLYLPPLCSLILTLPLWCSDLAYALHRVLVSSRTSPDQRPLATFPPWNADALVDLLDQEMGFV